jgi:hypothetical protein
VWLEVLSRLGLGVVTLVVGVAGTIIGVLLTPAALITGLGAIGFSAVGPIAGKFPKPSVTWHSTLRDILGSIAAVLQAGIGSVVAGSLFAVAQSIAMGGAIPVAVIAAGAVITGIMAAAVASCCSCFLCMGGAIPAAVIAVGTGIVLAVSLISSLL